MTFKTRNIQRALRSVLCAGLMLSAAGLFLITITPGWGGDKPKDQGKIPFPRPDSHKGNWIEYHGASAKLTETGQTGSACLTCHERSDCFSCHNTRMPRDHTNFWRTRGHGLMAEGNRERCLTCHKQDYCVRCHNETAPRSHRGNWASTHCLWCHYESYPVPADNCRVCHPRALH